MASTYLDPKILAKVGKLDLKAKYVVEGFISGMHKSPFKGFSVEFAQHRGYVPGDDLKHLDWKVYAALAYVRANGLDRVVWDSPNAKLGIVTTGKSFGDTMQALADLGIRPGPAR